MTNQGGGHGSGAGQSRSKTATERIAWNDIQEPGSYVDIQIGELVRLPERVFERRGEKNKLLVQRIGKDTPVLVMLTADADIPISDARTIVEQLGYPVDF